VSRAFKQEMQRATAMQAHGGATYWSGYIRGLRRAHHGDAFGTAAEHEALAVRRDRFGDGYRDGLAFGSPLQTRQDVIRALLRQRGWTHPQLAHQLGMGATSVSRYLMEGGTNPSEQAWRLILAMWHDPTFLPAELADPTEAGSKDAATPD